MSKTSRALRGLFAAALLAAGCQTEAPSIEIDKDDIAGVVRSSSGPGAGVCVIAETSGFDIMFARIVVSDEGRYLVPDLPEASDRLWVRGYGLTDSEKVDAKPGSRVDLTAVTAADAATAAKVYPAAYWYAMRDLPDDDELEKVEGGRNAYLMWMKNMGCVGCHQMGQLSTRTLPEGLGEFESSEAAWLRRISSGQAGGQMAGQAERLLAGLPLKYLADWSDRIAAGELPAAVPERPKGVERNVVATVRDWSNEKVYMHDLSGTDRRDPTVNGYGPLDGAPELSTDEIPILDPVANTATVYRAPVRDEDTPTTHEGSAPRALTLLGR